MFIKKWQLIFLYTGRMAEWGAGPLTVIVGRGAGHLPTKIAIGPGFWPIFQMLRGGMLAAGIDPHINADVNLVLQEKLLILFLIE